jgi:formamidopyrimidine-DNA glycosylase
MPELPEVETTRRGLAPYMVGKRIARVVVRDRRLRWLVPAGIETKLVGTIVSGLARRGKYLLIECEAGALLWHLGMSGCLRVVASDALPGKHDHVDMVFSDGTTIRFTDPRRFGALLWAGATPETHPLLVALGPEPLERHFSADWLHGATRGGRVAIKLWLMDAKRVAGIGNIYANEALFRAGIRPTRAAGRISRAQCELLVPAIRDTLRRAIRAGGSSLRNFVGAQGEAGYFQQEYLVYGRDGESCTTCGTTIRLVRQGNRSSYFCPRCQR